MILRLILALVNLVVWRWLFRRGEHCELWKEAPGVADGATVASAFLPLIMLTMEVTPATNSKI